MTNPLLSLWLDGTNAWMGAAYGQWCAEVRHQQARMMRDMNEQAICFWTGAWMLSVPDRKLTVAERMAALSLQVVEGGRH